MAARIVGGLTLLLVAALCVANAVAARWLGIHAPHVEVISTEDAATGSKLDPERLEAVLDWSTIHWLNRPIMSLPGKRLRQSVIAGAYLADANIDDPPATGHNEAPLPGCNISVPGGENGATCLDMPEDIKPLDLRRLLARLDRAQREENDDTHSARFLEATLGRLADWYGVKLADRLSSSPDVQKPPKSEPIPDGTPSRPKQEDRPRPATLLFPEASTALAPSAIDDLARVATDAKQHSQCTLLVMGSSDAKGNADQNLKLAYRRALAVTNLILENGVPQGRIVTLATMPGQTGSIPRIEPADRRVEINFFCGTGTP